MIKPRRFLLPCSIVAALLLAAGTGEAFAIAWTTLDYPGAVETVAHGIDELNVVGWYTDASGQYHGFVATIPEPATCWLALLGAVAMMAARRTD